MSKPLIISIGPALCGKTTYLESLSQKMRVENKVVAIDDIEGVYFKFPIAHARRIITGSSAIVCKERFADRRSHGLLHSERLLEESGEEGRIVLQLLCGDLTFEDAIVMLESVWMKCASIGKDKDVGIEKEAALIERHHALIEMIGKEIKEKELRMKSRYYLMFCGSAIPYAATECKKALERFAKTEPHAMVCFGNTNTIIGHYAVALDIAHRTNRPVQFARFKSEMRDLSVIDLYQRNLKRFSETGKYIPLHAIARQMKQAEDILLVNGRTREPKELCELAGFVMTDTARVEPKRKAARGPPPSKKVSGGRAPTAPPEPAWKKVEDPTASMEEEFPDTVIGFSDPYGDGFADPNMYDAPAGGDMPSFSYADASSGVTLAVKEIAYREEMAIREETSAFEIPPSDENIAALVEMGFDLESSLEALKAYGDNLDAAMNALLGG